MNKALTDRTIISGIGQSAIGRRLGRDALELTAEACLAAVADAGLTPADIDGLTTYPGASQPGLGFSGASLRDIHDALGIKPNWVAGGVESPGQLGAVVDAMLAVAGGSPATCCVGAASGRAPLRALAGARGTALAACAPAE